MPRDLEPAVLSAIQASRVIRTHAIRFDLDSGILRLCSAARNIAWDDGLGGGAATWTGFGRLGRIEPVRESTEIEAQAMGVTISGLPPGLLASVTGQTVQGRRARYWHLYLDAAHNVVGAALRWRGSIDTVTSVVAAGELALRVSLRNRLADWERPRVRRYTDADQKAEYAADRGFEFVAAMAEKEIAWGR